MATDREFIESLKAQIEGHLANPSDGVTREEFDALVARVEALEAEPEPEPTPEPEPEPSSQLTPGTSKSPSSNEKSPPELSPAANMRAWSTQKLETMAS